MAQTPNEPDRAADRRTDTRTRRTGNRSHTRSRVGGVWVASILFAVVLLLLLIFVLQNGQHAKISYMGAHGEVPQGVALLLAAIFGILLVALPGTARIIQLRIRERRHRTAPASAPPTSEQPPASPTTEQTSPPTREQLAPPANSEPAARPVPDSSAAGGPGGAPEPAPAPASAPPAGPDRPADAPVSPPPSVDRR